MQGFKFLLVVPTGIEPVPSESESEILSIKLKDHLFFLPAEFYNITTENFNGNGY